MPHFSGYDPILVCLSVCTNESDLRSCFQLAPSSPSSPAAFPVPRLRGFVRAAGPTLRPGARLLAGVPGSRRAQLGAPSLALSAVCEARFHVCETCFHVCEAALSRVRRGLSRVQSGLSRVCPFFCFMSGSCVHIPPWPRGRRWEFPVHGISLQESVSWFFHT